MKPYFFLLFSSMILALSSCNLDDTPGGRTPLLTITTSDAVAGLDIPYKVSISNGEGQFIESAFFQSGEPLELGLDIPVAERPGLVQVHFVQEIQSGSTELLRITSYTDIQAGSTLHFNPFGPQQSDLLSLVTVALPAGNYGLVTESDFSYVSSGFASIPFNTDVTTSTPDVFQATVPIIGNIIPDLFTTLRLANNPGVYYWRLLEDLFPSDTVTLALNDFNQITNTVNIPLPGEAAGWGLQLDGQRKNLYYPFFRVGSAQAAVPVDYFLPEGIFDQYYSRFYWRNSNGKTYLREASDASIPVEAPVLSIDMNITSVSMNSFEYTTSGPVDYVRSRWVAAVNNASGTQRITWQVFSPPNPAQSPIVLPTIGTEWAPNLIWANTAPLEYNFCEAVDESLVSGYEASLERVLDNSFREQYFERIPLNSWIERVYPVAP